MVIKEIVTDIKEKFLDKGSKPKGIYFVACGGSWAGLWGAKYLMERESSTMRVGYYTAAHFVQAPPKAFDKDCIAVFCSLKGTPEVTAAMKYGKSVGATCIAIVGDVPEEMLSYADYSLYFKTVADTKTLMKETNITEAVWLCFELLYQFEDYPYYQEAMTAINHLEDMATRIRKYVNRGRAQQFAEMNKNEEVVYVIAGAPAVGVGYAFSLCSLMEIQWIHSPFQISAEYFHGSFETLDKNTSVLHLLSDGPTREEDLRVDRFLPRFGEKYHILDAKELGIDEIDDHVKEYFNHQIFDVALREYITQLAIVRNHSKDVRRYMWKLEY